MWDTRRPCGGLSRLRLLVEGGWRELNKYATDLAERSPSEWRISVVEGVMLEQWKVFGQPMWMISGTRAPKRGDLAYHRGQLLRIVSILPTVLRVVCACVCVYVCVPDSQ